MSIFRFTEIMEKKVARR